MARDPYIYFLFICLQVFYYVLRLFLLIKLKKTLSINEKYEYDLLSGFTKEKIQHG